MHSPLRAWRRWADARPEPVLLDAGLGHLLAQRAHDLGRGRLWTARLLLDDPPELAAVAALWLAAGADLVSTATYQASPAALRSERALSDRAVLDVFRRSVTLLRAAIAAHARTPAHAPPRRTPAVAASMGPFAALQPGADEYAPPPHPAVPPHQLRAFHAARCAVFDALAAEGHACDIYIFETIPALPEALAIVDVMAAPQRTHTPFWISFQCRDATHLAAGTQLAHAVRDVLHRCADRNLVAVGVNCVPVHAVQHLVRVARHAVHAYMHANPHRQWLVDIVAYPNSGEVWHQGSWTWPDGQPPTPPDQWAHTVYHTGARIIGGCCRVGPDGVRELDALRTRLPE